MCSGELLRASLILMTFFNPIYDHTKWSSKGNFPDKTQVFQKWEGGVTGKHVFLTYQVNTEDF